MQPGGRQVCDDADRPQLRGGCEKRVGGTILYAEGHVTCAKSRRPARRAYLQAAAFNEGANYELIIVETKAMEQEVVADAAALKQGLAAEGKVALYGLYFDTGKAVVKPESEPTLVQVVKLLQQNAQLKVFVVGHTDGAGTLEANLKLSADRAAAVVAALVSRGIDAGRLKAAASGRTAPWRPTGTTTGRRRTGAWSWSSGSEQEDNALRCCECVCGGGCNRQLCWK